MKKPHQRTIKPDPAFTPFPVSDGDELFSNGIFVFNISGMIQALQDDPSFAKLEIVQVRDFHREFSKINESHVETVDPRKPIILAEISPGRFNLIDGNHRVEKARRLGLSSLPAFRLTPAKHIRFLTSKKAYLDYIEYWNGNLIDSGSEPGRRGRPKQNPESPLKAFQHGKRGIPREEGSGRADGETATKESRPVLPGVEDIFQLLHAQPDGVKLIDLCRHFGTTRAFLLALLDTSFARGTIALHKGRVLLQRSMRKPPVKKQHQPPKKSLRLTGTAILDYLATSGPVTIQEIAIAMGAPTYHHFIKIMNDLKKEQKVVVEGKRYSLWKPYADQEPLMTLGQAFTVPDEDQ